jgi:hypothetical protein
MLMLAKEIEQRCVPALKMQPARVKIAATHLIVSCSALQHTLAMCAASVLEVTALLSHSDVGLA